MSPRATTVTTSLAALEGIARAQYAHVRVMVGTLRDLPVDYDALTARQQARLLTAALASLQTFDVVAFLEEGAAAPQPREAPPAAADVVDAAWLRSADAGGRP